jgi:hypothetical protein
MLVDAAATPPPSPIDGLAVIVQALTDAQQSKDQAAVQAWLQSPECVLLCELLEVPLARVQQRVEHGGWQRRRRGRK